MTIFFRNKDLKKSKKNSVDMLRNQKDGFYFDDYVVAIMVGMGLFILPFLGKFVLSTFRLETF